MFNYLAFVGSSDNQKDIDPRLETIVNRMFQRCFDDQRYKQAVGIALETHRIDIFEKAILESGDIPAMLLYSLKVHSIQISCMYSTTKYNPTESFLIYNRLGDVMNKQKPYKTVNRALLSIIKSDNNY